MARIRPPAPGPRASGPDPLTSPVTGTTGQFARTDVSASRTADTVDTAEEGALGEHDEETDTSFTSLENHLFGARYFEHHGELADEQRRDQTTMLHKAAAAADTVVQRSLDQPPPIQVVTELPPGARPVAGAVALPSTPPAEAGRSAGAAPRGGNMAAAGGVFAGVSMVAAGSLVALGVVCAVAVYVLLARPSAPGTVAAVAVPAPEVHAEDLQTTAASIPSAPPTDDPALAEMRAGVRFPAEFSFNDWHPRGVVQAELDAMIDKLGHCPDRIRVTGHSDQKGTDWANDTFALARAGEVRRILGTRGIDRRRIEVTSAGSADPEVDADTPEGRAYNRRVIVRCY